MPHSPEFAADDEERRDRTRRTEATAERRPSTDRPTRRRALAATGAVALGITAGCLDSALSMSGDREEIEPERPGDDPDGTPAEFYHHLEEAGITVDELYVDTGDNHLILFYESDAETRTESDREIKRIYETFRDELVDRGADVEHLYTEVIDRFDGQVEGWGANSQWAEVDLAGQASEERVGAKIEETKVYPDGVSPPSEIDDEVWNGTDDTVIEVGNGASERNETNDGGETDDTE